MTPRTWALVGGSVGTLALGYFARPISTGTNKVYVSVRRQNDFDALTSLPNPLLANFCIYTDPLSVEVSDALKSIVNSQTPFPVSCVDIESDEPDVQDILRRYAISQIPTIVAIHGGDPISYFKPKNLDNLEQNLRNWILEINS